MKRFTFIVLIFSVCLYGQEEYKGGSKGKRYFLEIQRTFVTMQKRTKFPLIEKFGSLSYFSLEHKFGLQEKYSTFQTFYIRSKNIYVSEFLAGSIWSILSTGLFFVSTVFGTEDYALPQAPLIYCIGNTLFIPLTIHLIAKWNDKGKSFRYYIQSSIATLIFSLPGIYIMVGKVKEPGIGNIPSLPEILLMVTLPPLGGTMGYNLEF